MGTKNNPGAFDCHAKAHPDEPLFTLLARDPVAPAMIWMWASLRELHGDNPAKTTEARQLTHEMLAWQRENGITCLGFGQAALVGVMELIRSVNIAMGKDAITTTPTTDDHMRLFLAQTKFDSTGVQEQGEKAEDAFFAAAATFCEIQLETDEVRKSSVVDAEFMTMEQRYQNTWHGMLNAYLALRAAVVKPACATCNDTGVIPAAGAGQEIAGVKCPDTIPCPDCHPSDAAKKLRAPVPEGGGKAEEVDTSAIARARFLVASPDVSGSHQECRKLLAELLAMVEGKPA